MPGTYLWYCTEIKDTLVLQPRHIHQNIGDVTKGIVDELVETLDCPRKVLQVLKIFQTVGVFTPGLSREEAERFRL